MKNFIVYLFIALAAAVAALFCIAYIWDTPKRGDVIALYSPEDTERLSLNPFETQDSSQYIKRIIAVQGDTVDIENQKIFVNGNLIDEPYIMEPCDYDCSSQKIPAGNYFVLGDNRNHSDDSHRGWLTSRLDIIGKVCLTYWHSEYPDIHVVLIPIFFVVVGTFSKDTLVGFLKRLTNK
jgi:signal peptidase I